ncbi:Lrp/AsnC family transcriptional regulator [Thauera sp. WB-2]|uniref:Lrp/AsnC family transcriptional regulator n=1 Tax=Thauera sp. WB-2 TaxID=2897772 RepID=UPI0022DE71B3|nr:AsnC family transcriptional regulator [Thauera sp. WB-2]WBL62760.1 AsnC family transcriptional regulator [Thauera sp. WB-2]
MPEARERPSGSKAAGRQGIAARRAPDDVDRRLINALQGDFPLVERPFAQVADAVGLSEEALIARLQSLLDDRVLTRFGPMFQIERMGGAFCLAAMAVPEARWGEVVEAVNAFTEVAHNYRREHALNMWFVLATETPGGIADCAARMEAATGLPVHLFPKEREYFVEMKLEA